MNSNAQPTLYHFPISRSSKALWLALELGVHPNVKNMELSKGQHKEPEFLKLNPMGQIPTLVDGELVINESLAICLYLLDKYDTNHKLAAASPADRAKYVPTFIANQKFAALTTLRFRLYDIGALGSTTLEPVVVDYLLHTVLLVNTPGHKPELAEAAKQKWGSSLAAVCEQKLGDKQYIFGDSFSAGDVLFGYPLFLAKKTGLLDDYPKLDAYLGRLTCRESCKQAFGIQ